MSKSIIAKVKQAVNADQVSRLRNGNIMIRKGYFYRGKQDQFSFAKEIKEQLALHEIKAEMVNCGDHWASFKGGASVSKQSHFWVELGVDNVFGSEEPDLENELFFV